MSGARSPHARTPPLKFNAAKRGPIIYPTPIYAGLTSGERNKILPLVNEIIASAEVANNLN